MNSRNRNARSVLRDRERTHRAATRIRRRGVASLATHVMATGLRPTQARTVATSLRRQITKAGLTGCAGRVHAGRHMRDVTRYTPATVAAAAALYRPRKTAYKLTAAALRLAA